MGSQQLYSLSWGEFGTSLTSTVQVLRGHGEMVDVTLTAGGKIFPAHKLVLSAASPLLMELLKSTHCQHPVVMLAGITAPDLEALLQFVYQGEVSVDPNQLPSLLQAAYCLDIQALSPQTLSTEKSMAPAPVPNMMNDLNPAALPPMPDSPMLPVRKRKRKQRNSESESVKWTMTESRVESAGMEQVTGAEDPLKDETVDDPQHCNGEQLTPPLEGKSRCASERPRLCPLCGLLIRQARNLRRHLLSACASRQAHQLTPDQADYLECQVSTPEPDQYQEPPAYLSTSDTPVTVPDLHQLTGAKEHV